MPNDELRDQEIHPEEQSLSSEAGEFGELFLKLVEIEYTDLAARLSDGAAQADYRRTMAEATFKVFLGFVPAVEDVAQLLSEASASLFAGQLKELGRALTMLEE